jgi:hypothetical protein
VSARRAPLLGWVLMLATPLGACGGVAAPDLFVVERSGPSSQPALTVLVNEEGVVRCNRGAPHRLSDPAVIEARTIQEELHAAATHHLSLPARAGSVYGYRVRDAEGSASFADNSSGQPKVFERLQLFALRVAQQVCGLPASG